MSDTVFYDAPNGVKYGFPRVFSPQKDETLAEVLLRQGYPKEDIEYAIRHTTFFSQESSDCKWSYRCPECDYPLYECMKTEKETGRTITVKKCLNKRCPARGKETNA